MRSYCITTSILSVAVVKVQSSSGTLDSERYQCIMIDYR